MDSNPPAEDAARPVVENALVQLAACAVRSGVINAGEVVLMLRSASHVQTVQRAGAAFLGEHGSNLGAGERAAQRERVRGQAAALSLADLKQAHVVPLVGLLLQPQVCQAR